MPCRRNVADNGPVNGDRMFDWVGVYNIYYLCPATYGAYVSIRDQSPAILDLPPEQAATDGALTPRRPVRPAATRWRWSTSRT